MKYKTTNVALNTAIVSATIAFNGPGKLKFATQTVNPVITINVPKMTKYIFLETTCSDISNLYAGPSLVVQMCTKQIKKREQENPNYIHEVPIQSGNLDWRMVSGRKAIPASHPQNHAHDAEPDDHM